MSAGPPPSTSARPLSLASLVAVLVGGFVGTLLRFGVDLLFVRDAESLAVSTLAVNVVGSFALGVLVAAAWRGLRPWARAGLGAGLLGSFTTFSALTDSVWALTVAGAVEVAIVSIVASVALGLGAAVAGIALGRRLRPHGSMPLTDGSDE